MNAIFVWEINVGLILQIQPTISSVLANITTFGLFSKNIVSVTDIWYLYRILIGHFDIQRRTNTLRILYTTRIDLSHSKGFFSKLLVYIEQILEIKPRKSTMEKFQHYNYTCSNWKSIMEPITRSIIALGFFFLFFLFILFSCRHCLKRQYLVNFCIGFAQISRPFITIIIAEIIGNHLLVTSFSPSMRFLWVVFSESAKA